jgi:hypothetical protein
VVRPRAFRLIAAVVLLLGVTACSQDNDNGTLEWVTGLQPGHCADPVGKRSDEVTRVRRIPCDRPHSLETYARVPYPVSGAAAADDSTSSAEYPGNVVLQVFAREACASRFRGYLGTGTRQPWFYLTYLYPSSASWAAAEARPSRLGPLTHVVGQAPQPDRSVVCVLRTTGQLLTRSVHGPTSTPASTQTSTPTHTPSATRTGDR